jgi:DNA polymerase-3 subunit gamma/tau
VPITVLSRCQRFDLRRVDAATLSAHFVSICEKEGVQAEEAAIAMIARAADGSVRDGLSILDQAMALDGEKITAQGVEEMLGLADRAKSLDLLEQALSGEMPGALDILDDLYRNGADPLVVMQDLLDLTHMLTKLRAVPEAKDMKHAMAADEVKRAGELAGKLSMPTLGKTWQVLLKGLGEVQGAPNPQAAAEMVVIRLSYAADLPDPAELIKRLQEQGEAPSGPPSGGGGGQISAGAGVAPVTVEAPRGGSSRGSGGEMAALAFVAQDVPPASAVSVKTLEDVVAALEAHKEILLASQVYQYAHLVKLESLNSGGRLEINIETEAPANLSQNLGQVLSRITGNRWMVSVSGASGQPTLAQSAQAALDAERAEILEMPIMKEVLSIFPEAQVKAIKHIHDNKDDD